MALSLCSKNGLDLYYPSLLQNVSVSIIHLKSLYSLLYDGNVDPSAIKSLRCWPLTEQSEAYYQHAGSTLAEIKQFFPLPNISHDETWRGIENGFNQIINILYPKLKGLETLIVLDSRLRPNLLQQVDGGRFVPQHFLTKSLKKLYFPLQEGNEERSELHLSARNAVWILLFCEQLSKAALGVSISLDDFKFLSEYRNTFEGLSKVTELAIQFCYAQDDNQRKSWWDSRTKHSTHRSKFLQSEAMAHLLSITNQLYSLEVGTRRGTRSPSLLPSISSLYRSYKSMKLLRLFAPLADPDASFATSFCNFSELTNLCLEFMSLRSIQQHKDLSLPPSLSVISIWGSEQWWSSDPKQLGDYFLIPLLQSQYLPNLREVIVEEEETTESRAPWAHRSSSPEPGSKGWENFEAQRRDLEALDLFKDGKVKLTKHHFSELGEYQGVNVFLPRFLPC